MAIKIRVIVNGNMTRPPMMGNQIVGRLVLKNGENWVDNDLWNEVKEYPIVQQKLAQGIYIVPSEGVPIKESLLSSANSPTPLKTQIVTEQIKVGTETINIPTQIKQGEELFNVTISVPTITDSDIAAKTDPIVNEQLEKVTESVVAEEKQIKESSEDTVNIQPTKTKKSATQSQ